MKNIFVAMDGGTIASTVRLFTRTMWLRGRAVPMGGIGEVSTKDAYRSQGLAGKLLEMAITAMNALGMDISLLFGDQALYTKLGWRFCFAEWLTAETGNLAPLADGLAVRPFQPEDLGLLMGIYDFYAGRLQGALLRSEAYWKQWVLPQWNAPYVLIAEERPAAYCCVRKRQQDPVTLLIDELCAAPQAEPMLPGFLRAVAERERAQAISGFAALLPGLQGDITTQPDYMMARLNKPAFGLADSDALARAMRPCGMFRVDSF